MREAFITKAFRPASLALISKCDEIVIGYQAQGLRLTLRQLYYQLVVRPALGQVRRRPAVSREMGQGRRLQPRRRQEHAG